MEATAAGHSTWALTWQSSMFRSSCAIASIVSVTACLLTVYGVPAPRPSVEVLSRPAKEDVAAILASVPCATMDGVKMCRPWITP